MIDRIDLVSHMQQERQQWRQLMQCSVNIHSFSTFSLCQEHPAAAGSQCAANSAVARSWGSIGGREQCSSILFMHSRVQSALMECTSFRTERTAHALGQLRTCGRHEMGRQHAAQLQTRSHQEMCREPFLARAISRSSQISRPCHLSGRHLHPCRLSGR